MKSKDQRNTNAATGGIKPQPNTERQMRFNETERSRNTDQSGDSGEDEHDADDNDAEQTRKPPNPGESKGAKMHNESVLPIDETNMLIDDR